MSKRPADSDVPAARAPKAVQRPEAELVPDVGMEGIEGELEDPYGDSESEDEIFEAGEDGQPDNTVDGQEKGTSMPWRVGLDAP